ncbi:hypothetical protein QUB60_01915 [Microcoleus sp. A2-C5]|uniref:hypothetical protein n=1 Tax=unclassified Microcoleus TaxID=2642155 RepID=UPI002FD6A406
MISSSGLLRYYYTFNFSSRAIDIVMDARVARNLLSDTPRTSKKPGFCDNLRIPTKIEEETGFFRRKLFVVAYRLAKKPGFFGLDASVLN